MEGDKKKKSGSESCHLIIFFFPPHTDSVLHSFTDFGERSPGSPDDSQNRYLYKPRNKSQELGRNSPAAASELIHFSKKGCLILHSMVKSLTSLQEMNAATPRRATKCSVHGSISPDRLFYCYWCSYLVRHNWIPKYNITHSSCWGLTFSIRLLMHIQVNLAKC